MDGYTLRAQLVKARRRFRLNATEQALYQELVDVCNCYEWNDVFDCSNMELCSALLINEKTLIKARNSLINAGLIFYKSGKSKRSVSSYSFTKEFKTTVKNTVDSTANSTVDDTANQAANSTDLYKLKTETKTKSKENNKKKVFVIPTLEEVTVYCTERNNSVSPYQFIDFYTAKGWKIGKESMKDWKACVRTWENNDKSNSNGRNKASSTADATTCEYGRF